MDCLEAAIRTLLGDSQFEMNCGECGHHRAGLLATAAPQDANHKTVIAAIDADRDMSIREFNTTNVVDQFQHDRCSSSSVDTVTLLPLGQGRRPFPSVVFRHITQRSFGDNGPSGWVSSRSSPKNAAVQYLISGTRALLGELSDLHCGKRHRTRTEAVDDSQSVSTWHNTQGTG